MFLLSEGVFCVDRNDKGQFIRGHKVLATRNKTTGKFISWNKITQDIDRIIVGVLND